MQKVLIANRGEIAVRVIRACRDAGYGSVAVYAEPDRDALHVRMADEAYRARRQHARPSPTSIIDEGHRRRRAVRRRRGAPRLRLPVRERRLRPGRHRRRADLDRPVPQAIRDLGDKVTARHIAMRAGAPLVPGTPDPVSGPDEVRGVRRRARPAGRDQGRVRRRRPRPEDRPHDGGDPRAVRRARCARRSAAFGRGECFVERYLDQPRHVEAQVLADQHGNVIVVGTRDCSLQRRNQKLVEEAPAPFLTDEQREQIHSSRPRRSAARPTTTAPARSSTWSAATGRHQLPRGEHPAAGRAPGHRGDHRHRPGPRAVPRSPTARRCGSPRTRRRAGTPSSSGSTARTRAAASCPRPGTVTTYREPAGPGVRVDSGIEAELGHRRRVRLAARQADRHRRDPRRGAGPRPAARWTSIVVDGMATALPFHRAVVRDPAFTRDEPFTVFTRWIETEFDNQIPPFAGAAEAAEEAAPRETSWSRSAASASRCRCRPASAAAVAAPAAKKAAPEALGRQEGPAPRASGDALTAPMQGTIVKVAVDRRRHGRRPATSIVVLEAMKMEQPLNAHKAGTITGLRRGRRGRHVRRGDLRHQGLTIPPGFGSDCFDRCGPAGALAHRPDAGRRTIGGWRSVRR